MAHIVSFDDDDGTSSYCSTSPGSSVTSPLVKTFGVDLGSVPTIVANSAPRAIHGFSGLVAAQGSRAILHGDEQNSLGASKSGIRDIDNISKSEISTLEPTTQVEPTRFAQKSLEECNKGKNILAEQHDPSSEKHDSNQMVCSQDSKETEKMDMSSEKVLEQSPSEDLQLSHNERDNIDRNSKAPGKAVFNELRCPSVMTGNISVVNVQTEHLRDSTSKDLQSSSHENNDGLSSSSCSSAKPPSFQDSESSENSLKSSQEIDGNNEALAVTKELLLDWKPSEKNENISAQVSQDKHIEQRDETVNGDECKEKRTESISTGYANMVLDRSNEKNHTPASIIVQNVFMPELNTTRKETDNTLYDTQPKPAGKESVSSKGDSANDFPSAANTPSPARHASRPESLKGVDILERYKIPRPESPDSMQGSVTDSIKTTDSIKQRFGRWDSTDSADVRSITSNSSFGETVSPPGLTSHSDKIGIRYVFC